MTRALAIQAGVAGVSGLAGIAMLARAWRHGTGTPARQALFIAGTMAVMLAIFLGGFAVVASMAGAVP